MTVYLKILFIYLPRKIGKSEAKYTYLSVRGGGEGGSGCLPGSTLLMYALINIDI